MPRKTKNIQDLEVLENTKPLDVLCPLLQPKVVETLEEGEEEEEIQASKLETPIIPPAKKERKKNLKPKSPLQLEAMAKGRAVMLANTEMRRVKKAEQESINKIEMEKKIVTKAIAIKKKQIKKEAVLELSSDEDDDEPIQKTKPKKQVRIREPSPPLPPQFMFV